MIELDRIRYARVAREMALKSVRYFVSDNVLGVGIVAGGREVYACHPDLDELELREVCFRLARGMATNPRGRRAAVAVVTRDDLSDNN